MNENEPKIQTEKQKELEEKIEERDRELLVLQQLLGSISDQELLEKEDKSPKKNNKNPYLEKLQQEKQDEELAKKLQQEEEKSLEKLKKKQKKKQNQQKKTKTKLETQPKPERKSSTGETFVDGITYGLKSTVEVLSSIGEGVKGVVNFNSPETEKKSNVDQPPNYFVSPEPLIENPNQQYVAYPKELAPPSVFLHPHAAPPGLPSDREPLQLQNQQLYLHCNYLSKIIEEQNCVIIQLRQENNDLQHLCFQQNHNNQVPVNNSQNFLNSNIMFQQQNEIHKPEDLKSSVLEQQQFLAQLEKKKQEEEIKKENEKLRLDTEKKFYSYQSDN